MIHYDYDPDCLALISETIINQQSSLTLKLHPGADSEEVLRGSESDLLYTVQIDQRPALLYCLSEHQSTPDAWMPLRLLRYILGIWEQYRKQNPAGIHLHR